MFNFGFFFFKKNFSFFWTEFYYNILDFLLKIYKTINHSFCLNKKSYLNESFPFYQSN